MICPSQIPVQSPLLSLPPPASGRDPAGDERKQPPGPPLPLAGRIGKGFCLRTAPGSMLRPAGKNLKPSGPGKRPGPPGDQRTGPGEAGTAVAGSCPAAGKGHAPPARPAPGGTGRHPPPEPTPGAAEKVRAAAGKLCRPCWPPQGWGRRHCGL